MSKPDITTQELFLRLGSTSMLRRSRADALFRRLRIDKQDQIADALMRAPRRLDASDFEDAKVLKSGAQNRRAQKTINKVR